MTARIVLFGATGYTGGLTARSLVDAGARPVLAGRDADALEELAGQLGGLETVVVDAEQPTGVMGQLLAPEDVLVTTVGPFQAYGEPALRAAVAAGAHYLDSTGEAPFIRRVFDRAGPPAHRRSALLPAFGYDFVPGNLAAALALQDAGGDAVRVDVGYFNVGQADPRESLSSGTLASVAGVLATDAHGYRGGKRVRERAARRTGTFRGPDGEPLRGVSVGGTEQLSLPRAFPHLREVNVHVGWLGALSPVYSVLSAPLAPLRKLPGAGLVAGRLARALSRRTRVGPSEQVRAASRSLFVADARDGSGRSLATVHLDGPNGYTLTADLLAWGACRLAEHGPEATGAVGPVEAFGLGTLEEGAASVGLRRVVAGLPSTP